jgi:hypothetical protein
MQMDSATVQIVTSVLMILDARQSEILNGQLDPRAVAIKVI